MEDGRLGWWKTGTFRDYALRKLQEQQWRIGLVFDQEDLEQQAYLVFLHLVRRYPEVTEEKHLMSLFKTTLAREVCDIAAGNGDVNSRHDPPPTPDLDENEPLINTIAVDAHLDMEFRALMASAPKWAQKLLRRILEVPAEDLKLRRLPKDNRKHLPVRETTHDMLCRIIDAPPGRYNFNLAKELRKVLAPTN